MNIFKTMSVVSLAMMTLAACSSPPSYEYEWRHRTELTVTVINTDEGIQKQYLLGCKPGQGDHPYQSEACAQLFLMENTGFVSAANSDRCQDIEDPEPFEGRLEGHYDGQPVYLRVFMTTDCQVQQWEYYDKVFPLDKWRP